MIDFYHLKTLMTHVHNGNWRVFLVWILVYSIQRSIHSETEPGWQQQALPPLEAFGQWTAVVDIINTRWNSSQLLFTVLFVL